MSEYDHAVADRSQPWLPPEPPLRRLAPRVVDHAHFNPGDKSRTEGERRLDSLRFTVHSFSGRSMPDDPDKVVFFPNFSEFGSELVASLYCMPAILARKHPGRHSVVMGWRGRQALYRHIVDEYWELEDEAHWLREYCRAFHHASWNLKKAEARAAKLGVVVPMNDYALHTAMPRIPMCWRQGCGGEMEADDQGQRCPKCGWATDPVGIYHDLRGAMAKAVWPPPPTAEKLAEVAEFTGPRCVGVTARARKCYGRNLSEGFYARLVLMLEDMGYRPVWIGERETTLPAPFSWVPDFSRHPLGADLEATLALVSTFAFTLQYWTASTRLAGLVGTPFLLFESPDQLWGGGHEGMRLKLCSRGPHKIVLAHYPDLAADHGLGLDLTRRAVREMEAGDWSVTLGPVEDEPQVLKMRREAVAAGRWY